MKILIIILLFVSCEKKIESIDEKPAPNPEVLRQVDPEIVKKIELINGEYMSDCVPDENYGHKFLVTINDYEVVIVQYSSRDGDNCSSHRSRITIKYDILDNELLFKDSEYWYFYSEYTDATYICNQYHMSPDNNYNIDNIGCSASWENEVLSIVENGEESYLFNGRIINMI